MVSKETLVLSFSADISSSVGAAFKKVSSSIQEINEKLEKVRSAGRKIQEFRELKRGLSELRLKMRTAGSAGRRLTEEFREQARRLRELREELRKAGIDVKKLAAQEKHLASVGKLLEKQKISLEKAAAAGERRRSAFEGIDTVLAPAMALTAPVMLSVDYQKALAEVSTLTNLTAKEFQKKYGAAVLRLSRELGASPTEVVKAMYQAISSGVAPEKAIEFLRQAGKAAIAGVTDIFTATDGLTTALNAWKAFGYSVKDISDYMFVAVKAGKTTFGEIARSIGNVAGIAPQAGIKLQEVLAAMATITTQGLTTSEAFTGIRASIECLMNPTSQAEKWFKKLGVQIDANTLKQKGLRGTIEYLMEAVRAYTDDTAEQKKILGEIFGSVEALNAVFILSGSGAKKFSEILKEMGKSAGATEGAYKKMAGTAWHAFNKLKASVGSIAVSLGSVLLPPLAKIASAMAKAASAAVALSEKFPRLTHAAVLIGGGILAGATAINIFARMWMWGSGAVLGAWHRLKAAYYGLRVAWLALKGEAIAGTLSGWRLAVYRCAMAVRGFTLSLWQNVRASAAVAASRIRSFLSGLPALLGRAAAAVRALNLAMLSNPWLLVAAAAATAAVLIATHWDWVKKKLAAVWNAIKAGARWIWNALKRFAGIASWFMPVIGPLRIIHALIKKFFHIDLFSAGKHLVISLAKGIWSVVTAPVQAIKKLVSKIRRFLPFSPAKEGPLATLDRTGPALVNTIAKGIIPTPVTKAVSELTETIRKKLVISPGRPPRVGDLTARVRYLTEAGRPPGVGDLTARIKYLTEAGEPPRVKDLSARVRYLAEGLGEVRKGLPSSRTVNISVNFAPRINTGGGESSAIRETISRTLADERERLRKMLEELIWEERRLSYA